MQLSNGDSARCCGWACGRKTGSSTSRERQAFSGSKIAPLRQQQRLSERRAFWRFLALKAAPLRQQQHLSERQALLALQQRLCSLFFHRGGCVEVRDKRAAAPQRKAGSSGSTAAPLFFVLRGRCVEVRDKRARVVRGASARVAVSGWQQQLLSRIGVTRKTAAGTATKGRLFSGALQQGLCSFTVREACGERQQQPNRRRAFFWR